VTESGNPPEIYQLHFLLRGVNPPVWRRVLVRSASTIADLRYILQIAFNWSDSHLHRFVIRGKEYGIGRSGCTAFRADARQIHLADFRFRLNERFLYEYDFRDSWQHQIRLEAVRPAQAGRVYPVCIAGSGVAPPEDCGGPWAYMEMMDHQELDPPWNDVERIDQVLRRVMDAKGHEKASDVLGDVETLQEAIERVKAYLEFRPDRFRRRPVNRRLKLYAEGNEAWREEWEES
jgi:hypothetical protein